MAKQPITSAKPRRDRVADCGCTRTGARRKSVEKDKLEPDQNCVGL